MAEKQKSVSLIQKIFYPSTNERSEVERGDLLDNDGVGGFVADENLVRLDFGNVGSGHAGFLKLCLDHLGRLAERQRLRLRQEVGQQDLMVEAGTHRVVRLCRRDEVARDQTGALMDQLVEGVLAVCARLAPHDRTSAVVHWLATAGDVPR